MRSTSALLLLVLTAYAGEGDGGSAAATRWTHPRGPASRSCMSDAKPLESLGDVVWRYKADPPIGAVPLTWDGIAYLRQGDRLVALDTDSGKPVASQSIPGAADAALDGGAVYLRMGPRIVQWWRRGTGFTRRWSAEVGEKAGAPCLFEGELYLTSAGRLVRLRPGRETPAWKAGEGAYGAPALLGEEVYALEGGSVVARSRLDGKEVARLDLGLSATDGLVAVNGAHVCARVGTQWVIARRVVTDGKLELSRPWQVPYTQEPLVYQRSTIGWAEMERTPGRAHGDEEKKDALPVMNKTFMLFRWIEMQRREGKGPDAKVTEYIGKEDRNLVQPKSRPDLLEGTALPISLDGWFCTGMWCADLNANRINWHLRERADRPLLPSGVGLRPVPAEDGRLMLASRDGKELICMQPEVIGK
jgi:hypothetical protein